MKLNYLWCVHRELCYESIGEQILKIGLHFLKLLSISSSILFETQCRMTQKLISESLDVVVKNTKDYFFYSKVISNTRRYSKQKTCWPFNSHSKIAEQRTIIQQYSDFIHFDAKLTRNGSLNEHYEQHLPLYLWSFLFFSHYSGPKIFVCLGVTFSFSASHAWTVEDHYRRVDDDKYLNV